MWSGHRITLPTLTILPILTASLTKSPLLLRAKLNLKNQLLARESWFVAQRDLNAY